MGLAINGHAVRVRCEKPFTDLFKLAPALVGRASAVARAVGRAVRDAAPA